MIKTVFEVRKGDDVVKVEKFTQRTIKIGCMKSSDIRIDDDSASRMHCVVEATSSEVVIIDLGSLLGTYVNGVRVNKATLNQGDVIVVGNYTIEVKMIKPVEDPRPSEPIPVGRIFGKTTKGETAEQVKAQAVFLSWDASTALKAVLGRMSEDKPFQAMMKILGTAGKVSGVDLDQDEVDDLLGELDEHAETLKALCGLAEGLKGKFDIPRAVKAVDGLFDELEPLSELIKKRGGEFRAIFDSHLQHACLLRAQLVADMTAKGIAENHAMEIMTKTWGSIIKSAFDGVAKAQEAGNKKS